MLETASIRCIQIHELELALAFINIYNQNYVVHNICFIQTISCVLGHWKTSLVLCQILLIVATTQCIENAKVRNQSPKRQEMLIWKFDLSLYKYDYYCVLWFMVQASMGWYVSAATTNVYRFIIWVILRLIINNFKKVAPLASHFVFRVKFYFGILKSIWMIAIRNL